MKRLFLAALLGLSCIASAASAQPDAAAIFGAREGVEDASLSPNGRKVAYLAPLQGQASALFVGPLDGSAEPKAILVATGDPDRLSGCKWAADTRLVCEIYGVIKVEGTELAYFTRQLAVDDDGKNVKVLINRGGTGSQLSHDLYGGGVIDWLPEENGNVLMMREFVPESTTGSLLGAKKRGVGVVRVNTRTLATSLVEAPKDGASEFITDGRGNVRISGLRLSAGTGYETGKTLYRYRTKYSRDWKTLSTVDDTRTAFDPHAVDPELDVAYGIKKLNGRLAAYSFSLDGSAKETLLFAHPQVDVDGFVRVGRRGRVIGVSYATDRRQARYFDTQLEKLAISLGKAIPNLPLIRVVDASLDESKLLIWAGSDINPGRYFLFDRAAKSLAELMPVRPHLDQVALAPVKAVSYRAADGVVVPAYLTLPPGKQDLKDLPALVMPHGGPGARDEWGFDWLSQFYANRGYAVLQPNFRGSAGYGDAWFQKNGFQNWKVAIGDVNDGGRWLVSQGVNPAKMAIIGWSYGGYAALQSAVADPGLFKAVVAIAPVTDLDMLKEERRGWTDFALVNQFVGSGRHVEEGSPARNAARIKVPVMLFHGAFDWNVGIGQSRRMASSLKDAGAGVELITYDKLDHYLQDADARKDMLLKSEGFLRQSLGL